MLWFRGVLGVAVISALACAGDGTGPDNGGSGNGAPTLSGDVQPILTANCALSGCHAGSSPAQGMNLAEGQTHQNTVDVPSSEAAGVDRIEPGQPDESYLVHKIQGTQTSVGGSGSRMPLGGNPLTQEQIDLIRAWIADGAGNN
ncbi:MAG: hypothetical protein PVF27_00610 [Gemmatimonadales bacterium]|jgi:hypothetical protein